ncbi:MAG TPA: autotransporter-associated beta strand repeat-containing protein, partial [Chlamydiales bacterium]|nr:autotransporter-associated beta strand repeat-containing protein [Chlamydiales bacterium]
RAPSASNPGISISLNSGGAGTISLNGHSTYGGNGASTFTNIFGGTVTIADDSSLGASQVPLIFAGTSSLTAATPFITASTRPITINSGVTATFNISTPNTFSGSISMGDATSSLVKALSGALTLNGNNSSAGSYTINQGTLILGGVNSYSGDTTVNGSSTLQGGAPNAFSSSSSHTLNTTGSLDLNGLAQEVGSFASPDSGTAIHLGAGTLQTGAKNETTEFKGLIDGSGGLTCVGTGALTLSGTASYTGSTILNSSFTLTGGTANAFAANSSHILNGTSTLNLNNISQEIGSLASPSSGSTVQLGSGTLQTGSKNVITDFAGQITGTTGGLTTVGSSGILTLSGVSSYNGPTNVNENSTLRAGSFMAFTSSSSYTLNTTGTLDLNGISQEVGSFSSPDSGTTIHLGSGTLQTGAKNETKEFQGLIDGSGGVTCIGTGMLTLSGTASYTGPTILQNSFTLTGGVPNAFAANSSHILNGTSTLNLNDASQEIGSLASPSSESTVQLGSGTLQTGSKNVVSDFAGQITGTGGLTCVGSGTLILSGTSTYNGPTTISSGTLIVTGSLQSVATVLSGALLKGNGSLQGASILAGGTIQA